MGRYDSAINVIHWFIRIYVGSPLTESQPLMYYKGMYEYDIIFIEFIPPSP